MNDYLRIEFEALSVIKGLDISADFMLTKPPKFLRYTDSTTQKEWEEFKNKNQKNNRGLI